MKKYVLFVFAILLLVGAVVVGWQHDANRNKSPASSHHETAKQSATRPTQKLPSFDKTAHSTTDPTSPWVIVNKQHPLTPLTYAPTDLLAVGGGQYMRSEAAAALGSMLQAATAAGYSVTPASGYRSYDTQVSVYNAEVKSYGQATADSESARPGYSEHQTGWAMDLSSGGCSITDCFGTTPGGKWIIANAYKYGFFQRYPAADTAITGYRDETWHFRYVGIPLATELHDKNIPTLEQFFDVSGGTTYK